MKKLLICSLSLILLFCAHASLAEWTVVVSTDATLQTSVATIVNEAGYTLEIYKDRVAAIRSRFSLSPGLLAFNQGSCPTFQIDTAKAQNLSVNNASCLASDTWAEYILAYVNNDRVESSTLLGMMNGRRIYYRFRLANGDYREVNFSLQGSKRALTAAIGEQVQVARTTR